MDNSQNNTLIENPTTNNSSSIDEFIFNMELRKNILIIFLKI